MLDGLKLALLGIFLISYLALSFPGYQFRLPKNANTAGQQEDITDLQEDSIYRNR